MADYIEIKLAKHSDTLYTMRYCDSVPKDKVKPDMVVMRNIQRLGIGQYLADDLPLLGPAEMQLNAGGNLAVNVKGAVGPVSYKLIPESADDRELLEEEIALLSGGDGAPQPAPEPGPPGDVAQIHPLAACDTLGLDPATTDVICLD